MTELIRASDIKKVTNGPLTVLEFLGVETNANMSIAVVSLNGDNAIVINHASDAAYWVIQGKGSFEVWEGDESQTYEVGAGDMIYIPKGTVYRDWGRMNMIAVHTPAFDLAQVEKIEQ